VKAVSISGYPEGLPDIPTDVLWGALPQKAASLREQGLDGTIITQFGFDTEPVIKWISDVRERGIDYPIRVGVPGPAGVKRLLGYACRFGLASSAGIVQKYGFSLSDLLGTAGPDRFVIDLASRLDGAGLGTVKLHFYTFGGCARRRTGRPSSKRSRSPRHHDREEAGAAPGSRVPCRSRQRPARGC